MTEGAGAEEAAPPLRAWLGSMGGRTRALLEFHVDREGEDGALALADSVEAADVVIVDYDYPGVRAEIESGRWRDGPPLVALAHASPRLNGALVLPKPLDRSRLDALVRQLRDGEPIVVNTAVDEAPADPSDASPEHAGTAPHAPSDVAPFERADVVPPERTARRRRPATDPTASPRDPRSHRRVDALCGPPRTLDELADAADPVHRYDPSRHPVATLARSLGGGADERGVAFDVAGVELYVLPWLDRVCTSESLTWTAGVERVFGDVDEADITRTDYTAATLNALIERVRTRARQAFSTDAFRWLAALFSARGRLPYGVELDRPLQLAHWPNLSRLEATPDSPAIVAAWTARPRSIADVVREVGCEPRYVTALYAATTAAGLLRAAADEENGEDDGT